jgi:lipoyl(octanoyl) transferase
MLSAPLTRPVAWTSSAGLVPYPDAVVEMEAWVARMIEGQAAERVWLLQHPPVYTAGTSAKPADLIEARFPVYQSGRGGQYTYHGPGQRIGYVMLDLKQRQADIRAYVRDLEEWLIRTLKEFGVSGERRSDRVGIWVVRSDGSEDKIAAIGVRVRRWISFHGVSLNVAPQLEHFSGIVPCGVQAHGVTSLADLGIAATMPQVDGALRRAFESVFGATTDASISAFAEQSRR